MPYFDIKNQNKVHASQEQLQELAEDLHKSSMTRNANPPIITRRWRHYEKEKG